MQSITFYFWFWVLKKYIKDIWEILRQFKYELKVDDGLFFIPLDVIIVCN